MQIVIDDNIRLKNFYKSFFGIWNINSLPFIKYNSSIFYKKSNLSVLIVLF